MLLTLKWNLHIIISSFTTMEAHPSVSVPNKIVIKSTVDSCCERNASVVLSGTVVLSVASRGHVVCDRRAESRCLTLRSALKWIVKGWGVGLMLTAYRLLHKCDTVVFSDIIDSECNLRIWGVVREIHTDAQSGHQEKETISEDLDIGGNV
jgi:hypothetical protein